MEQLGPTTGPPFRAMEQLADTTGVLCRINEIYAVVSNSNMSVETLEAT